MADGISSPIDLKTIQNRKADFISIEGFPSEQFQCLTIGRAKLIDIGGITHIGFALKCLIARNCQMRLTIVANEHWFEIASSLLGYHIINVLGVGVADFLYFVCVRRLHKPVVFFPLRGPIRIIGNGHYIQLVKDDVLVHFMKGT